MRTHAHARKGVIIIQPGINPPGLTECNSEAKNVFYVDSCATPTIPPSDVTPQESQADLTGINS